MVRKLGQMLMAAVLFAAGCRDLTMDLLPAPPAAAAGVGNESAGGMAGEPAEGGWGGGFGGTGFGGTGFGGTGFGGTGFGGTAGGGFGGTGQCSPGTNLGYPGCPCTTDESCLKAYGIPFCSLEYGRCVRCLTDRECSGTRCGCELDEVCSEARNSCVPRCSTDNDCSATAMFTGWPYCDRPNSACVECTTEKQCENHSRSKLCNEFLGNCVECFSNDDCDEDAPICNLSNLSLSNLCQKCTDSQCEGKLCQCGEGKQCREGRCILRPSPQPEP